MSAALVPIGSLPPEIWSQIFMFLVTPLNCSHGFRKNLERHPLFVISLVCTRWHTLATSMGPLWSHIHMDEYFVSNQCSSDVGRWISLWLKRSNGASLSLQFSTGEIGRSDPTRIISLLQPHISKVTSLIFDKASNQLIRAIFKMYSACSPSTPLTTLVVDMPQVWPPKPTWLVGSIRGLHTLTLCGRPDPRAPSSNEFTQILLNNPDLYTLRVRHYASAPFRAINPPTTVVDDLELLEIEYDIRFLEPEKLFSVLEPDQGADKFDLASKHLTNLGPGNSHEIQMFLERANVTRLDLKDLRPQDMRLVSDYLDRAPHLRELCLNFATRNSDSTTFDALTTTSYGGETRARCSNLRTLMISNVTISSRAQTKFKQMVEVHRLSKLVLGHGTIIWSGKVLSNSEQFLGWLRWRIPTFIHLEPGVVLM
ncbi:hypothetical protein FRC12_000733 [Ceratobasidium sp. 428]|nr:hypothetical protein FRC12_000733 [Ceratobasidium sp. 428]